jgi:hypothetical protein
MDCDGGRKPHAVDVRFPSRPCSGGAAERPDRLKQFGGCCRHCRGPCKCLHLGRRQAVSDHQPFPALSAYSVRTAALADGANQAVAIAVALASTVEVTQAVEVSVALVLALALWISLTIPLTNNFAVAVQHALRPDGRRVTNCSKPSARPPSMPASRQIRWWPISGQESWLSLTDSGVRDAPIPALGRKLDKTEAATKPGRQVDGLPRYN